MRGGCLVDAHAVSFTPAVIGLLALPLAGLARADVAAALPLPCPMTAGWQVDRQISLPRRSPAGEAIGGFSAVRYHLATDSLLLLSDLPSGAVLRWSGLSRPGGLDLQQITALRSGPREALPAALDGEGLVVLGDHWWVASEGRRSRERPPQLLRFSATSGDLISAIALPDAWQPGEGQGLASNAGPESLLLLGSAERSRPPALLMAAEQPLLQDPPQQVRLLRWQWPAGADPARVDPQPQPQGALLLPHGEGWGLTDLLAPEPGRLLGLLRRFEPPDRWQIRLALYPLPPAGSTAPVQALAQWDLIAMGLSPDNWEGLSLGPPLPDGRPSLLLASDDNLNPLQANRLALLTANRPGPCPAP
ncbi:esterase-like activity of phytase family protein [Vulcanococcus limneticus Candia 3F8]|nr:esterase-like activity of phytase family protein [Vulcanococcus limneticus MW73D5]MCP9894202.1 esterase-like activity of phytase family protein [Vulcanococcus limneticus Candia 3F8]MCP9897963.1 esterase-like activity of phytase family protein [Vulcanococcus limneticus Candia 3B3]